MEFGDETATRESARRSRRCLAGARSSGAARLGRGEPAIVKLISPLAMVVVAATVLVLRARLRAGAAGRRLFRERPSPGAARRGRGAAGGLARSGRRRSEADPHPGDAPRASRACGSQEEPPQDAREVQSLIDSNGRIIGWFSWEPERPATAMITQLLPFGASDRARAVRLCDAGDVAAAPARLAARQEHARRCRSSPTRIRSPACPTCTSCAISSTEALAQAATGRSGGGGADRSRRLRRDEGRDRRRRRGRGADRDRQPAAQRCARRGAGCALAWRQVRAGDARGRRG